MPKFTYLVREVNFHHVVIEADHEVQADERFHEVYDRPDFDETYPSDDGYWDWEMTDDDGEVSDDDAASEAGVNAGISTLSTAILGQQITHE